MVDAAGPVASPCRAAPPTSYARLRRDGVADHRRARRVQRRRACGVHVGDAAAAAGGAAGDDAATASSISTTAVTSGVEPLAGVAATLAETARPSIP